MRCNVYFRVLKENNLPTDFFITKRILRNEAEGKKVSKPIIRISIISIALTIAVNIITLAIVTGFQNEVKYKISGFGSHAFVMNSGQESIFECDPIVRDSSINRTIKETPNVRHVQPVAYKPVLLQSAKSSTVLKLANGRDSTIFVQEMEGCVLKGVNSEFDNAFFESYLISGNIPEFGKPENDNKLVVSTKIAESLRLKVGDTIGAFFVKSVPVKRVFIISAIYETGLEEFDKKIVIGSLNVAQELNDWGIRASIEIEDTVADGYLIIKAQAYGGNGNYRYNWGRGYESFGRIKMCPVKDTVLSVIVSDYWSNILEESGETSIPDTAYLKIKVSGEKFSFCNAKLEDGILPRKFLSEDGNHYSIRFEEKKIEFESMPGAGSSGNYIGGYEVMVDDWARLDETLAELKRKIEFKPTATGEILHVNAIMDSQKEVFVWLDFLNVNVAIIVVLMILIGMINMSSALLVLILVKTNFIGVLKSMGAGNLLIRKVFLYQATYLIFIGMIFGNAIGLGFALLQEHFHLIPLNPKVYYLNTVPVEINWWHVLLLNAGTLVICFIAMLLPSFVITRISPAKAIKFN